MHIPGKFSRNPLAKIQRSPRDRFFRIWASARIQAGHKKLTHPQELMRLPHAHKVAQIAGNARRLAMWQDACEQANEIAANRRAARQLSK